MPPPGSDLDTPSAAAFGSGSTDPGASTQVNRGGRRTGSLDDHPDERAGGAPTFTHLGRYKVVQEIGRGRFGVVYEAVDEKLDRRVAIKKAKPEALEDDDQLRRFKQEAELASGLEHPGIVPIYEIEHEGDDLYIVMGLCADRTLNVWMDENRDFLTPGRAVRCLLQIAEAIGHGHRMGVVHRDLKPDNIGVSDAGGVETGSGLPTLRVLDYGLSYNLDSRIRLTRSSVTMGTPLYMAPEQLRTSDVTSAADVYALGSILYELLTGRTPFQGNTSAEIVDKLWREQPQPPQLFNRLVPAELGAICLKCLEKKAGDRYPSANELHEDLTRWLRGQPTEAQPDTAGQSLRRWAGRRSRVTEAGAVLVMLHLFLPVWSFGGQIGARFAEDGMSAGGLAEMLVYLAALTIPLHAAFAWTGLRMWKGDPPRKFAVVMLAVAAFMLVWHFGRAVRVFDPPTQWYADHPSAAWMVFWMLSLTSLIDLIALSLGLYAARRVERDEAERSGLSSLMKTAGGSTLDNGV